jgi:hypothetical protein
MLKKCNNLFVLISTDRPGTAGKCDGSDRSQRNESGVEKVWKRCLETTFSYLISFRSSSRGHSKLKNANHVWEHARVLAAMLED